MKKISEKLIINEISGNTCNITYLGREFNNCIIEVKETYVFIGLPEHYWCGEFCPAYEEGPIIGINIWNEIMN